MLVSAFEVEEISQMVNWAELVRHDMGQFDLAWGDKRGISGFEDIGKNFVAFESCNRLRSIQMGLTGTVLHVDTIFFFFFIHSLYNLIIALLPPFLSVPPLQIFLTITSSPFPQRKGSPLLGTTLPWAIQLQ